MTANSFGVLARGVRIPQSYRHMLQLCSAQNVQMVIFYRPIHWNRKLLGGEHFIDFPIELFN
jgi:hypothetical protein